MSRAVVHDPKDAASGLIRLLPHNLAHKPIDGSNSTFDFTAAEDSCSMDIPGWTWLLNAAEKAGICLDLDHSAINKSTNPRIVRINEACLIQWHAIAQHLCGGRVTQEVRTLGGRIDVGASVRLIRARLSKTPFMSAWSRLTPELSRAAKRRRLE